MALLSQRGKILQNLQRQLQTITVANGFSRDVQDVSFNVQTWTQVPEANTPVIYIIDETASYAYHPGKLIEVTWNISLFVVLKNRSQTDLEEFLSDIDYCLTLNQPLSFSDTGIVASQVRLRNIITDRQMFAEIENSQLAKISIDVIYIKCYGQR